MDLFTYERMSAQEKFIYDIIIKKYIISYDIIGRYKLKPSPNKLPLNTYTYYVTEMEITDEHYYFVIIANERNNNKLCFDNTIGIFNDMVGVTNLVSCLGKLSNISNMIEDTCITKHGIKRVNIYKDSFLCDRTIYDRKIYTNCSDCEIFQIFGQKKWLIKIS